MQTGSKRINFEDFKIFCSVAQEIVSSGRLLA
jgi:hypothetical protein